MQSNAQKKKPIQSKNAYNPPLIYSVERTLLIRIELSKCKCLCLTVKAHATSPDKTRTNRYHVAPTSHFGHPSTCCTVLLGFDVQLVVCKFVSLCVTNNNMFDYTFAVYIFPVRILVPSDWMETCGINKRCSMHLNYFHSICNHQW